MFNEAPENSSPLQKMPITTAMVRKVLEQVSEDKKNKIVRLYLCSTPAELDDLCRPLCKKLALEITGMDDIPIPAELVRVCLLSDYKDQLIQQLAEYVEGFLPPKTESEPAPLVTAQNTLQLSTPPPNVNENVKEFLREVRRNDNGKLRHHFHNLSYGTEGGTGEEAATMFKQLTFLVAGRQDLPLPPAGHLVNQNFLHMLDQRHLDEFRIFSHDDLEDSETQAIVAYIEASVAEETRSRLVASDSTQEAWKVGYIGDADKLLHSAIVSMYNESSGTRKAWKNFSAILQGSGTGKSRLVDKLAESVFTIPLVLRPHDDTTGYPLSDHRADNRPVHSFFHQIFKSAIYASRIYLLFLLKTLSFADKWIDEHLKSKHKLGLETVNIAACWQEYLGSPRSDGRVKMYEYACDPSPLEGFEDMFELVERNFASTILPRVGRFIDAIAVKVKYANQAGPLIVFYFDEAHHLTKFTVTRGQEPKRTAYHCLCKAFTYMLQAPIFGLFLSTYSQLSQFSPSARNFWSSRPKSSTIEENDHNMNAPFVELPFDIWKEQTIVTEGDHDAEEICSLRFMARFGRPLYWTMLESDSDDRGVMRLAMDKLQLRFDGDDCPSIHRSEHTKLVPLLAARVDFTFESNRDEAVLLEGLLVASSMRTVYSVPQHRQYLRGGYPSEPFLAEAAARVMFNHFASGEMNIERIIEGYKEGVPSAVLEWFQQGLIEKGQRGELVARILCTLAHDIAILNKTASIDNGVSFSEMVSVIDFLEALIGEDLIQNVLDMRPTNAKGKPLKEVFKHAYVHFTQFVKAAHPSVITEESAYLLFTRGAAIQGYGNMPAADLVIPVWIRGDRNPDRWSMTAILIQVKNRSREQDIQIDAVKNFEFFGKKELNDDERPYITIGMQLGILDKDDVSSHRERFSSRGRTPHPYYHISLSGCSHKVYNVITQLGEHSYSGILGASDILSEHPRTGLFLDAVKRMKPWWDRDSYKWAKMRAFCRLPSAKLILMNNNNNGNNRNNVGAHNNADEIRRRFLFIRIKPWKLRKNPSTEQN